MRFCLFIIIIFLSSIIQTKAFQTLCCIPFNSIVIYSFVLIKLLGFVEILRFIFDDLDCCFILLVNFNVTINLSFCVIL